MRADEIRGSRGKDLLYGNRGDDTIWAGKGSDHVWGGDGNDVIHIEGDNRPGSDNMDRVDCGPGHDTVYLDTGGGTLPAVSSRPTLFRPTATTSGRDVILAP
jgi:Ca2+-binding RTX toxin-like protein